MSEKSKFPDPGILGLSAFVVSQALLNIPNTHLVPALATPLFVTVTLVFGGGIQLLCALFEYLRGNQFSMIIFGTFGAFFISLSLFVLWELNGTLKFGNAAAPALGTFLLVWTIIALVYTVAVFREDKTLGWMFVFVDLAFIGGTLSSLVGLNSAFGGWAGIISCVIGLYQIWCGLMAITNKSPVEVVEATRVVAAE